MRLLLLALLLSVSGCGGPAETAQRGLDTIRETRVLRAQMEIRQLRAEVEQHHALRGVWPADWTEVRRAGVDPWGNPYELEIDGSRAIVISNGPDGEAGTGDDVHAE